MSNRTIIELNHDYCPNDSEIMEWAQTLRSFMRSPGYVQLPPGVTLLHYRHHSQPCPIRGK